MHINATIEIVLRNYEINFDNSFSEAVNTRRIYEGVYTEMIKYEKKYIYIYIMHGNTIDASFFACV